MALWETTVGPEKTGFWGNAQTSCIGDETANPPVDDFVVAKASRNSTDQPTSIQADYADFTVERIDIFQFFVRALWLGPRGSALCLEGKCFVSNGFGGAANLVRDGFVYEFVPVGTS